MTRLEQAVAQQILAKLPDGYTMTEAEAIEFARATIETQVIRAVNLLDICRWALRASVAVNVVLIAILVFWMAVRQ